MGELDKFKEMVASKAGSEQGSPPNVESVSQAATFGDRATSRLCGGTFPLLVIGLTVFIYLDGGKTPKEALIGPLLVLVLSWLLAPMVRYRGLLSPARLLFCSAPMTVYTVTLLTIIRDVENEGFLFTTFVYLPSSIEPFFRSPKLSPWSFAVGLQENLEAVLTLAPTAMILLTALSFGILFTKLARSHPWVRPRKPGLLRIAVGMLVLLGPLLAYTGLWMAVQPSQRVQAWLEETEKLDPLALNSEREVWTEFWDRTEGVEQFTYFQDSATEEEQAVGEEFLRELEAKPPQSLSEARRVVELFIYLQRVLFQVDRERAEYELAKLMLLVGPSPRSESNFFSKDILRTLQKTDAPELWLVRITEFQALIPKTLQDEVDINTRRFYAGPSYVSHQKARLYSYNSRPPYVSAKPLKLYGFELYPSPTNLWYRWNFSRELSNWLTIREDYALTLRETFPESPSDLGKTPILKRDLARYQEGSLHNLRTRPELETAELILELRLKKKESGHYPQELPGKFREDYSWERSSEGWELAREGNEKSWVLE